MQQGPDRTHLRGLNMPAAVGPTARIGYLVSISSLCPFSFVEIYAKLIP